YLRSSSHFTCHGRTGYLTDIALPAAALIFKLVPRLPPGGRHVAKQSLLSAHPVDVRLAGTTSCWGRQPGGGGTSLARCRTHCASSGRHPCAVTFHRIGASIFRHLGAIKTPVLN